MKQFLVTIIICVFGFFGAEALEAQSKTAADSTKTEKFDVKKRKKEVKLFLDKIEILGKIDKPQTVFIVQGKDPTVDDILIDRSFFKEIFRHLDKEKIRKIVKSKNKKK